MSDRSTLEIEADARAARVYSWCEGHYGPADEAAYVGPADTWAISYGDDRDVGTRLVRAHEVPHVLGAESRLDREHVHRCMRLAVADTVDPAVAMGERRVGAQENGATGLRSFDT